MRRNTLAHNTMTTTVELGEHKTAATADWHRPPTARSANDGVYRNADPTLQHHKVIRLGDEDVTALSDEGTHLNTIVSLSCGVSGRRRMGAAAAGRRGQQGEDENNAHRQAKHYCDQRRRRRRVPRRSSSPTGCAAVRIMASRAAKRRKDGFKHKLYNIECCISCYRASVPLCRRRMRAGMTIAHVRRQRFAEEEEEREGVGLWQAYQQQEKPEKPLLRRVLYKCHSRSKLEERHCPECPCSCEMHKQVKIFRGGIRPLSEIEDGRDRPSDCWGGGSRDSAARDDQSAAAVITAAGETADMTGADPLFVRRDDVVTVKDHFLRAAVGARVRVAAGTVDRVVAALDCFATDIIQQCNRLAAAQAAQRSSASSSSSPLPRVTPEIAEHVVACLMAGFGQPIPLHRGNAAAAALVEEDMAERWSEARVSGGMHPLLDCE